VGISTNLTDLLATATDSFVEIEDARVKMDLLGHGEDKGGYRDPCEEGWEA